MNPIAIPKKGDPIRADWAADLTRRVNALTPLAGDGMSVKVTPRGTVYGSRATATRKNVSTVRPFTVRYHEVTVNGSTSGQYEVYLPCGCMAVGSTCYPMNDQACLFTGHDERTDPTNQSSAFVEQDWFKIPVPESDDIDEWEIILHGKQRVQLKGATGTGANAQAAYTSITPFMLVTAETSDERTSGRNDPEKKYERYYAGDVFSQRIATVRITRAGSKVSRQILQAVDTAISIQGTADKSFDAVWKMSYNGENDPVLTVDHLYVTRQTISVGGTTITDSDPNDANRADLKAYGVPKTVWLKIDTRATPFTCEVVSNTTYQTSTNDVTWVALYTVGKGDVITNDRRDSIARIAIYGY